MQFDFRRKAEEPRITRIARMNQETAVRRVQEEDEGERLGHTPFVFVGCSLLAVGCSPEGGLSVTGTTCIGTKCGWTKCTTYCPLLTAYCLLPTAY